MPSTTDNGRSLAEFKLPLWARAVNVMGPAIFRLPGGRPDLTEASLLAAARRATRLDDFGDDDFLPNLRALVSSYEEEGELNVLGRIGVRQDLVRSLSNRLRIQADLTRHPEILDVPIQRPLFVVGLPRTGTTMLLGLLSCDPRARVPLLWQLLSPSPPPVAGDVSDARIAAARKTLDLYFGLLPEMRAIHPQDAMWPDECTFLLQNSFVSLDASARVSLRSYVHYLFVHDMRPEYRYYREQLQLLQWKSRGDHWVLKTPVHLLALDALLAELPDAAIVQTHRNPREVIPSLCSLTALIRRIFTDRPGLHRVGEDILSWWGDLLERGLAVRARSDERRFFDLDYRALMNDPIGEVRRVYSYFDYEFLSAFEERMRTWLAEHPQGKHGVHRYRLEEFGLTREAVDARFANYSARFSLT